MKEKKKINKMKIILPGNPLSTNSIYKFACSPFPRHYMNKAGKERKEEYIWEAYQQKKSPTLTCKLSLVVYLFFGDRRVRDWDNFHKLSMDALTEAKVWEDDSQIEEVYVKKGYDKEKPRIEILISEYKI